MSLEVRDILAACACGLLVWLVFMLGDSGSRHWKRRRRP